MNYTRLNYLALIIPEGDGLSLLASNLSFEFSMTWISPAFPSEISPLTFYHLSCKSCGSGLERFHHDIPLYIANVYKLLKLSLMIILIVFANDVPGGLMQDKND